MDRPERLTDLLGYMDAIIRASQKFSWPACVEYDVKFRQMAVGDEKRQWAALDASLYTECFTGQTLRWAVEAPKGRQEGQSREQTNGRKRMRMGADPPEAEAERADLGSQVCAKYNKYKGPGASIPTVAAGAEALTRCQNASGEGKARGERT